MEAIISAAETGFTGSLVGSSIPCRQTGTMTGCFFCPGLTMFLVSMPRQQSSALLQWEPPHWYLRPRASWIRVKDKVLTEPLLLCTGSSSSPTVMIHVKASNIRSGGFTDPFYVGESNLKMS
uniref:Uncharacterized protein n=1 Tax=Lates calcarifer TaxID=8187 RepID=A0A4W6E5A2_LATCA